MNKNKKLYTYCKFVQLIHKTEQKCLVNNYNRNKKLKV